MEATETQAAPSPAIETQVKVEIPRSSSPEYAEWRMSGKLPEKKPAEAPPASAEKQPSENAPAPDPEKQQASKRQPEIEARFKKLTDEIKRLSGELEESRKPKEQKTESLPAPRTYQEWKSSFKPTKWTEQYSAQNPDANYDDVVDALTEYKADVREYFRDAERKQRDFAEKLQKDIAEAESRYDNFKEIQQGAMEVIMDPTIPDYIRDMFRDSEVQTDLIYVVGEKPEGLQEFADLVKSKPSRAARYIAFLEKGILDKRSAKPADEVESKRSDNGQFAKTEPAKRGPESAPEPPIEIGQRGAVQDETERALSAASRGDRNAFKAYKEAEDAKELRQRRGL